MSPKTIAPISELFTKNFDFKLDSKDITFNENGDAAIREILENYIVRYCELVPSDCDYVVGKLYCPGQHCNGSTIGLYLLNRR